MSESSKEAASSNSALPVKWIVLGVVAIAFMLIFKTELGGLLERTSDVSITADGVKIKAEVKTVETPLGKTDVSVVSEAKAAAPNRTGVYENTYVNTELGFQISWPNSRDWTPDESIGREMMKNLGLPATVEMPIAILSNDIVDNFRPNINVVVEKIGQMTVEDYVVQTVDTLRAQGWEVVSSDIDAATNGGFIVLLNDFMGTEIYQFQKIALSGGNAYVLTVSQVPQGDLDARLKNGLSSILNSFRVIQ